MEREHGVRSRKATNFPCSASTHGDGLRHRKLVWRDGNYFLRADIALQAASRQPVE